MTIECMNCSKELKPEMEVCPQCGSRDRLIMIEDKVRAVEMLMLKDKSSGFRKYKRMLKQGEKISRYGKHAREKLIIDKEKGRKYHLVEEKNESGEWKVVHSEDEPLDKRDET